MDQRILWLRLPGIERLPQGISTKFVVMVGLTRQPTMHQAQTSMTKAT